MNAKQMTGWNRLICTALILAALLIQLFFSCLRFSSLSTTANAIDAALGAAQYYGSWMGLDIDTTGLRKVNRAMADGKISASEAYTVTHEVGAVAKELLSLGEDEDLSKLRTVCILYQVLYIGTLLSAAAAAGACAAGKRPRLTFPFAAMMLGNLIFFASLGKEVKLTVTPFLTLALSLAAACLAVGRNGTNTASRAQTVQKVQTAQTPPTPPTVLPEPEDDADADEDMTRILRPFRAAGADNGKHIAGKVVNQPEPGMPTRKDGLVLFCRACGCRNDPDAAYCEHCGKRIGRA